VVGDVERVEDVDAAHREEDAAIEEEKDVVVQEEIVVRVEGGEDKEAAHLMDFHPKSCQILEKEV
jgi:hypothetical protein